MGGRCTRRTRGCRTSRTVVVAAGASLALAFTSVAEAKPPPSPGLRVVWVADELSESEGRVRSGPLPGHWPEIERVELEVEGVRTRGTGEKRPALDAWGRRLPTPRVSGHVVQ